MIGAFLASKFISSIVGFWSRLPTTIKLIILGLVFGFCTFLYGKHVEKVKYEAIIQESINRAKEVDKKANQEALQRSQSNEAKYRKDALDFQNQLQQAAAEYQTLKDRCTADEEFIDRLNSIDDKLGSGLSKSVQPHRKIITPNK